MLYICIHNETKIEYAEEYPTETKKEQDWAVINANRLVAECQCRMPEIWMPYASTEKPFSFEVPKATEETTK